MNIDQVIEKLEEFKKEHGNIEVRVAESDDYWGTLYVEVDEYTLRVDQRTQLDPKNYEETKAVVFCSNYKC